MRSPRRCSRQRDQAGLANCSSWPMNTATGWLSCPRTVLCCSSERYSTSSVRAWSTHATSSAPRPSTPLPSAPTAQGVGAASDESVTPAIKPRASTASAAAAASH